MLFEGPAMRLIFRLVAGGMTAGLTAAGLVAGGPAPASGRPSAAPVLTSEPVLTGESVTTRATAPRGVAAPSAALSDAVSGAGLWNRTPGAERPMGSITKIMTAYVVIKAGNLGRVITVPKGVTGYDARYGASTAGLRPGERLTARQLLYAMLIPSGCDAAYALARAYGPGRITFIAKMNATAARLGLTRTRFTDFSGLPDPTEHSTYSDARDLVALGRAAMALPLLAKIVRLRSHHLAAGRGHRAHTWRTTDLLLSAYPGATGIKTGSTRAAGFCLLFEAVRGGRVLIGVVLRSSATSSAAAVRDAKRMLNWGFRVPAT